MKCAGSNHFCSQSDVIFLLCVEGVTVWMSSLTPAGSQSQSLLLRVSSGLTLFLFFSQWQNVPGVRLRSSDPSWLQGNLSAQLAVSPSMLSVSGGTPGEAEWLPARLLLLLLAPGVLLVELYRVPMMPCSHVSYVLTSHCSLSSFQCRLFTQEKLENTNNRVTQVSVWLRTKYYNTHEPLQ